MDIQEKLALGTVIIFLGDAIGAISRFGIRLIGAQHYGPSSYGSLVLAIATLEICALVSLLGLPNALAQRLARSRGIGTEIVKSILVSLGVAVIVSISLNYASGTIVEIVGNEQYGNILKNIMISLAFVVLSRGIVSIFRGKKNAKFRVVVENFISQLMLVTLFIIFVKSGMGIQKSVFSWPVAYMAATCVGIYLLFSRFDLTSQNSSVSSIFAFSLPLMLSEAIWTLMQNFDNYMIEFYQESSYVGYYDSAFVLCQVLLVLTTTFGYMLLPSISELHEAGNLDKMRDTYQRSTKWISMVAFPLLAVIVLFREPILTNAFGPEFSYASDVVLFLAFGFFIHILLGMNGYALTGLGKSRIIIIGNGLALVMNVLLNGLLIPTMGILGAGMASIASYIVLNVFWSYYLIANYSLWPLKRTFLVIPIISLPLLYLLSWLSPGVLSFGLLLAVFTYLVLSIGIDEYEKNILSKYLPRALSE